MGETSPIAAPPKAPAALIATAARKAMLFADWGAGEGIHNIEGGVEAPEDFLPAVYDALGDDNADLPQIVHDAVLAGLSAQISGALRILSLPIVMLLQIAQGMKELPGKKFNLGDRVRKTKGGSWHGRVCGFYSTTQTPIGYTVESEREPGSVQIYPEAALALCEEPATTGVSVAEVTAKVNPKLFSDDPNVARQAASPYYVASAQKLAMKNVRAVLEAAGVAISDKTED